MGACATNTTQSNENNDNYRIFRQGNLTFFIYGKYHIESLHTGKGCKKTPAWHTDLTETEIQGKIKEFWETRVDGNQKVWSILKQACEEADCKKVESLVKGIGLSMNNGLLMHCYDERGHRYDLPPFVINPPLKYAVGTKYQKLNENIEKKNLEVTFRAAGLADIKMSICTDECVREIKERYKEKGSIEKDLRLFFNGRELKDQNLFGHYSVTDGIVVQVFLKN